MNNLTWIEIIYWGSTIIGGTFFVLRTIMLLIGSGIDQANIDAHFDSDIQLDHDFDIDPDVDSVVDSDFSFKLLSMQGLTAFFMMFGLVGLALIKANLPVALTVAGGVFAGLSAVWIISLIFSQMKRLQSDGTIKIQNAIGQSGSVYLVIPAEGIGQVQITIQGALKIYDARSSDEQTIKTGEKIRVTEIINNNTLVVERI
jgi:membrane protein implicated in regulation of membrane protease activity